MTFNKHTTMYIGLVNSRMNNSENSCFFTAIFFYFYAFLNRACISGLMSPDGTAKICFLTPIQLLPTSGEFHQTGNFQMLFRLSYAEQQVKFKHQITTQWKTLCYLSTTSWYCLKDGTSISQPIAVLKHFHKVTLILHLLRVQTGHLFTMISLQLHLCCPATILILCQIKPTKILHSFWNQV